MVAWVMEVAVCEATRIGSNAYMETWHIFALYPRDGTDKEGVTHQYELHFPASWRYEF